MLQVKIWPDLTSVLHVVWPGKTVYFHTLTHKYTVESLVLKYIHKQQLSVRAPTELHYEIFHDPI